MLDSKAGWHDRGTAARVLALTDAHGTVASLLNLFFTQTDQIELWETALTRTPGIALSSRGSLMRFTTPIFIAGTQQLALWDGYGPSPDRQQKL